MRLPLGFAGGLADERTGLVLFGRRWYMPATGRFTAPDPIRSPEGDPDTYEYCIDDPVNRVDPLGLESEISQYPAPRPLDKEIGEAFELGEGQHYWTVTPNEGACGKCQILAGRGIRKEP